jgi:hypothetical protein
MVPDPDVLEPRYEDWLEMYGKGLADLRRAGLAPEPVEIDAEAFLAWCLVSGLAPDSAARARFAADVIRQRYESGQPPRGV